MKNNGNETYPHTCDISKRKESIRSLQAEYTATQTNKPFTTTCLSHTAFQESPFSTPNYVLHNKLCRSLKVFYLEEEDITVGCKYDGGIVNSGSLRTQAIDYQGYLDPRSVKNVLLLDTSLQCERSRTKFRMLWYVPM